MKFYKILLIIFAMLMFNQQSKANGSSSKTISGYGCNLGNQIYATKIGTSSFYGTNFDVYHSNGTSYPIDWNNTSQCGMVNANSFVDQKKQCWVNSYVNPKNDNTGVSYGSLVYYTTTSCVNLPLDDYIWVLLLATGFFAAYLISKRGLSIN